MCVCVYVHFIIKGLCGSYNNKTEDDFTSSSGIVENSAQSFALSWTQGDCTPNIPHVCINTEKGTADILSYKRELHVKHILFISIDFLDFSFFLYDVIFY